MFAHADQDDNMQARMTVFKQKFDDFIKGLVLQAKNGLGRTSQRQILQTLEYQFSTELEQRCKEWEEFGREHS